MTPWKGQHYLIEAFNGIASENPNAILLLVGSPVFDNDSYQQRLVSMVGRLGLKERVRFAGYRHDIPRVLAAMDVFAFTSIEKDTSPLALLSAMSCGVPIAAFDIDGVKELMTGDQCLMVPAGNVQRLADSLKLLIADESLRRRLAINAREVVTTRLSLDRFACRIEQVFFQALGDTRDQASIATMPIGQAFGTKS